MFTRQGISLTIHRGEKIGVVGHTGSGKSTLIQVLFRLIEPSAGKIIIDEINICTLGLHDVRSRFGIIPQDPVLFQGIVRSNIVPLGLYSEEEIWKVPMCISNYGTSLTERLSHEGATIPSAHPLTPLRPCILKVPPTPPPLWYFA
ncbi:hypothetical protein RJT34_23815 [Clitoria ternatea]|uniref:ABC transporter domain-containing protein n=1 Tax=Clitoria ternatea TaxID=43366 RepID=A0AAN9FNC7_CLITE